MKLNSITILLLAISLYSQVYSQNLSISGRVESDGVGVVGALVYSSDYRATTTTNNEGFFQIQFQDQLPNQLIASYVGLVPDTIRISSDVSFYTFRLKSTSLPEIVVTDKALREPSLQRETFSMEQLEAMPSQFLGEVDVIKSLTMLPGVSMTTEGISAISVRGGDPDQNLILYEDIPYYSIGHALGLVSTINPTMVKTSTLHKGYLPSQYGGRLSSVIDIVADEGNNQHLEVGLTLGLLNNDLHIEGPLFTEKVTISTSFRLTNLFLALYFPRKRFEEGEGTEFTDFGMWDSTTKLSYRINEKTRITATALISKDILSVFQQDWMRENFLKETTNRWGNQLYSIKLFKDYTSNWYGKVNLYSSEVHNHTNFIDNQYMPDSSRLDYNDRSTLHEIGAKWDNQILLGNGIDLLWGLGYSRFESQSYDIDNYSQYEDTTIYTSVDPIKLSLHDVVGYLDASYLFSNRSRLRAGIRLDHYSVDDYSEFIPQPRFSYTYPMHWAEFGLHYSYNAQPYHQSQSVFNQLPIYNWFLATADLPISRSHLLTLTTTKSLSEAIDLEVSLFYNRYEKLVDAPLTTTVYFDTEQRQFSSLVSDGKGHSYGLELLVQKNEGRLTGWIGGTLLRSRRIFTDINEGKQYPASFERPFDLKVFADYTINNKNSFSTNLVYTGGEPITLPNSYFVLRTLDDSDSPLLVRVYDEKNSGRQKNYFRVDVQYSRKFGGKKQHSFSLGAYNASYYPNFTASEVKGIYENTDVIYSERIGYSYFRFMPYFRFSFLLN